MRNKGNNAQTVKAQQQQNAAALANQMAMSAMPQTNLDEINMIIAAQTIQQNQQIQQQITYNQGSGGDGGGGFQYATMPHSTIEGQKKSQGQIMVANATDGAAVHGSSSNVTIKAQQRKHSPFRRNQLSKQTQGTTLAAKQMQAQMAITHGGASSTAQQQHQQWMNQTMPVNRVEGGGSGGSGGSGSQEQINDVQNTQKKGSIVQTQQQQQQQQRILNQQANQIANMKNVMLIDQMYQLQQPNSGQPPKQQARARSNMQQPHGVSNQMAHNQYLAQKNFLANVNSEMQIQTLAAGIKKGGYISQKRKQISKDMGNFETVQDNNTLLQTQSSKQRINAAGQNSGQTNSQNLRVSNYNPSIGHSKKNSQGQTITAQIKNGKGGGTSGDGAGRNTTYDRTFLMNNDHGLDPALHQQNVLLMNQQVAQGHPQHYRNTSTTIQGHTYTQQQFNTANHSQGKGSRQGSKLRKNISNMRGGGQLKNQQRVSQQRRFNNTTLDNYQSQLTNNQLSTLQAVVPVLKTGGNAGMAANMQTIQQHSSLGPSQQQIQHQTATGGFHHNSTGGKYDHQMMQNNNQNAPNMLKGGGSGQGSGGPSGHSRSVIRQNQQQKQYLNNFLAPNKYNSSQVQGGQAMASDFNNGQQMRINNQLIVNKNEPRSKSNLKAPYGQAFGAQQALNQHLLGSGAGQGNENSAQFNNYLSQQNYFESTKVSNGQSPLLKKTQGNHKKSESATAQIPSEQMHVNGAQKGSGHHSNSIEPNPGHKGNYSVMGQINMGNNNQILQNISNPNVTLYQQYNTFKAPKGAHDSLTHEGANSSMQRVKKCDSEISNTTAGGHNQQSGDPAIGGRTSSNDQEGNAHSGIQQLRRNQPHNFSNISEKSSIMGDYGGTHTTHNSNQAKKSRQGLGGGILGIMGSNQQQQDAHHHQQFFNNRNGSASHVGGSSNKTGGNVNNSIHSTQNTSNANNSKIDPNHPSNGSAPRNMMSNQKSKNLKQPYAGSGSGQGPSGASTLHQGSTIDQQNIDSGVTSINAAQRQSSVAGGSAGRQSSGQQQNRHSRNPSSKFQTQVVNMPGINNNKRIVIGQKQMQQMQGQMMMQTANVTPEPSKGQQFQNQAQLTAFQALQNQQQMQQHLQQLQKQQPQLKNVLRSGNRSSDITGYASNTQHQPSTSKKTAQKFRKGGQAQYGGQGTTVVGPMNQQVTQPNHNRIVSKAQQLNGTAAAGFADGANRIGSNVDFGFVIDPVTMQGVIHDTVEHLPGAGGPQNLYGDGNTQSNWGGARRLSMPMPPYQQQQQQHMNQTMDKDMQSAHGPGPVSKMTKNKMDIGQGIRGAGPNANQILGGKNAKNMSMKQQQQKQGNTGALDSGTNNPNHLYSDDHEAYDFEDEEEQGEDEEQPIAAAGAEGRTLSQAHSKVQNPTFDQRNANKKSAFQNAQQQQARNTPGQKAAGADHAKAKAQAAGGATNKEAGIRITTKPAPTRVIMNANAPKQKIGAQDQIVIKDNNVYLRDQTDDQSDTQHIGRLVATTGSTNMKLLKTGGDGDGGDIMIQDDSTEQKKQGQADGKNDEAAARARGSNPDNKVINYETFESSSEEEYSCGAFESAAASFQNKEKNEDANISGIQDQKRQERQRRKERKAMEKKKQREEQDRQGRNNIRKKYRIQSLGIEHYDQYQDDILNFKDSDRESLLSYFENNSDLGNSRRGLKLDDNFFYHQKAALDTPTRLLNHSNDFLPKKKKINADKLAHRAKQDEQLMKNIKNFQDIEQMSNLEKSQKSTTRKAEDEKKDMLFKIVSKNDIEKLRTTLRSQLENQV